jgi:DNA-binding CsgD family transcriptional regulator
METAQRLAHEADTTARHAVLECRQQSTRELEDGMELLLDSRSYRVSPLAPLPRERMDNEDDTPAGTISAALLAGILDQLAYGVMVLRACARVCYANREALRACGSAGGLHMSGGRLVAAHDHESLDFGRALHSACEGRRSMVTFRSCDPWLRLAVMPLGVGAMDIPGAEDRRALLVFGKPQPCEPLSETFFAREYGLTAAESTVLVALCEGLRPAQIAQRQGVAVSTVRTHIAAVRDKTGAKSIGALVRMVTTLPPMAAVVMS